MSGGYWLLAAHCTVVYSAIFPFNNVSAALLDSVYGMSGSVPSAAAAVSGWSVGAVQGVPYSVAAVATPLIGILVDKFGHRAAWMSAAAALLCTAHALLWAAANAAANAAAAAEPTATQDSGGSDGEWASPALPAWLASPLLPFGVVGVAYSIVAGVVWPSAMCVVDPASAATAFGVLNSAQNAATALVPLLVAAQLDLYGAQNYAPPEALFAGLSMVSLGFALALWRWDRTKAGGGVLTHPTKGTPVAQATPAPARRTMVTERSPLVLAAACPPPLAHFLPQAAALTAGRNTGSSGSMQARVNSFLV
jgi:MFS family permease